MFGPVSICGCVAFYGMTVRMHLSSLRFSEAWISTWSKRTSLIQFVFPHRGDPAESCSTLVVTWRREAGLPGPQWQSGAQHGFTSFHWDDLPEREAVPIPQGKHRVTAKHIPISHPAPRCVCHCALIQQLVLTGWSPPFPQPPSHSTDLQSHPPAALLCRSEMFPPPGSFVPSVSSSISCRSLSLVLPLRPQKQTLSKSFTANKPTHGRHAPSHPSGVKWPTCGVPHLGVFGFPLSLSD